MQIIQLLPTVVYGDAVSNDTLQMQKMLREAGYHTRIYAENIGSRIDKSQVLPIAQMPETADNDLLIYHASTGSILNYRLPTMRGRKLLVYHNITPPFFFTGYSSKAQRLSEYGYEGIRYLAGKVDACIADSEFNRQQLLSMGFSCKIAVCPVIIPFSDYDQEPDEKTIHYYEKKPGSNLLFVGRISPNKRQEDILRAFYCYKKIYDSSARLFLVGNSTGMEKYEARLKKYALALGISDSVVFSGHIRFSELLAYYRLADVFICMSDHEGFCVPIMEALYFDKPVVAYHSSAIPETLGKAGLLLEDKDPMKAATAIHRVLTDSELEAYLTQERKATLEKVSYAKVKESFLGFISEAVRDQD